MDVYSHVMPAMHQEAMDKLNQAFINLDEDGKADDDDKSGGVLAKR